MQGAVKIYLIIKNYRSAYRTIKTNYHNWEKYQSIKKSIVVKVLSYTY